MFALFVASFHVSKEIMFRGKEGGRSAGRDANLIIDVLDVVVYGLLGDDEKASYLLNSSFISCGFSLRPSASPSRTDSTQTHRAYSIGWPMPRSVARKSVAINSASRISDAPGWFFCIYLLKQAKDRPNIAAF